VRLKRPFSFLLRHPNVDGGGIPVVRKQDLPRERSGQARGARHITADDEYVLRELLGRRHYPALHTRPGPEPREQRLKTRERHE